MKIKYYPALVGRIHNNKKEYFLTRSKFKNEEEARKTFGDWVIRLIKDIPELIEEKGEA